MRSQGRPTFGQKPDPRRRWDSRYPYRTKLETNRHRTWGSPENPTHDSLVKWDTTEIPSKPKPGYDLGVRLLLSVTQYTSYQTLSSLDSRPESGRDSTRYRSLFSGDGVRGHVWEMVRWVMESPFNRETPGIDPETQWSLSLGRVCPSVFFP